MERGENLDFLYYIKKSAFQIAQRRGEKNISAYELK